MYVEQVRYELEMTVPNDRGKKNYIIMQHWTEQKGASELQMLQMTNTELRSVNRNRRSQQWTDLEVYEVYLLQCSNCWLVDPLNLEPLNPLNIVFFYIPLSVRRCFLWLTFSGLSHFDFIWCYCLTLCCLILSGGLEKAGWCCCFQAFHPTAAFRQPD